MKHYAPEVTFGSHRMVVNTNLYDDEKIRSLTDRVYKIHMSNSLLSKYPMDTGETEEEWQKRVQPLLDSETIRKPKESVEDHLKRVMTSNVSVHDLAFDLTNAIAETFGLKVLTKEEFGKGNYLEIKLFIFNVLNLGDIPVPEQFYPKKLVTL